MSQQTLQNLQLRFESLFPGAFHVMESEIAGQPAAISAGDHLLLCKSHTITALECWGSLPALDTAAFEESRLTCSKEENPGLEVSTPGVTFFAQ